MELYPTGLCKDHSRECEIVKDTAGMKPVNSVAMVINHCSFTILAGQIAPAGVAIYYGVQFAECCCGVLLLGLMECFLP